jgi:2-dehydropantoate 2-reductase
MIHAVLGAGGIGGFLGGALARAGSPVTLILRPEALAHHPGMLTVTSSVLGDFEIPVSLSAELIGPVDVLWIAVKATQLDAALAAVPSNRVGGALIVPLLNGIEHMAKLRSRYDHDHVIAGTIRAESERVAPGEIRQVSPFATVRLAAVGRSAAGVYDLTDEVRRAGLACEAVEDEQSLLWGKLAILAPLALSTTAKGASLGDVRRDPLWRAQLEACVAEVCAVAEIEGATVDRAAVLEFLRGAPDNMRSSMQKDVEAGRRPELDAIGGPIVRLGHAHGLDVSATKALMEMIARNGS